MRDVLARGGTGVSGRSSRQILGNSFPCVGSVVACATAILLPDADPQHGIAFGLLEGRGWLTIPLTLCVAAGLVWYHYRRKPARSVQLLTGLLLGGALGNFVDRLRLGYVVDMFDFVFWPVFNVADIAITCSLLGLVALQFVGTRASETPTTAGIPEEPPR
jgi:lipoprotein signal peptidase